MSTARADSDAPERLLKLTQVARMANVSMSTVWRDLKKGALKGRRTPQGRWRVPLSESRRYAGLSQ